MPRKKRKNKKKQQQPSVEADRPKNYGVQQQPGAEGQRPKEDEQTLHDRDFTRFADLLERGKIQFKKEGYCVIDNFLGEEWSEAMLTDFQRLSREGQVAPHYFQFGTHKFPKPNICEIDLHDEARRKQSAELQLLFHKAGPALVKHLRQVFPERELDLGPSAIKMQWNKGQGGCFPWHYDNPGPPSKRSITCIVYLNPHWKKEDGGEIALWPFCSEPVVIPPLMDRAVLFRSDLLLHRVMPSNAERFCFTVWVDGQVNSDKDVLLTQDKLRFHSWDEAVAFFQKSPLQRVVSRAVCHEEYEQSLVECVGDTPAEQVMVGQHKAGVASIEAKLRPLIVQLRQRRLGPNS